MLSLMWVCSAEATKIALDRPCADRHVTAGFERLPWKLRNVSFKQRLPELTHDPLLGCEWPPGTCGVEAWN